MMKNRLFIDTWGWVVIHNKREPRHTEVNRFYHNFRLEKGEVYTTDYVLDETITLLFRRLPFDLAKASLTLLNESFEKGYLNLEWISRERFEEAKQLRLRFVDKPMISFTDLTSMAIMKGLDIRLVLTGDEHFEQAGMGFKKVP
jgi:predicted nucleic acid-binding protein